MNDPFERLQHLRKETECFLIEDMTGTDKTAILRWTRYLCQAWLTVSQDAIDHQRRAMIEALKPADQKWQN